MNSIWLKIAGLAVLAVVVLVAIGHFKSNQPAAPSEPKQKEKTFYDMADRDKQFAQAPKAAEPQPTEAPEQPPAATPAPTQPAPAPQPPAQTPPPAADGYVMPSSVVPGTKLYCKPLSEEDEIGAEQLLPWAATSRSIGRLPMMSYGPTVRACRDILTRWPDSRYAWRAKQMLEDITNTSSRAGGFNITRQEMDVSRFLKPRPGAQEFAADSIRR